MLKRIADILEKFAVGSLLVGLYQQRTLAVILGIAGLIACLHVTRRIRWAVPHYGFLPGRSWLACISTAST